jgi:hypothetical protein
MGPPKSNDFWPLVTTLIFFQPSYCMPALHFYGYGFLASHLCLEPIRYVGVTHRPLESTDLATPGTVM